MVRLRFLLLALLAPLVSTTAFAQAGSIRKADEFYSNGGYFEAIPLYKDGLETVPTGQLGEYLYKIADCYRKLANVRQAELWFGKALQREVKNPLAQLYYAQALLQNEKYDLAKEAFQRYKELAPQDPRGENGLNSVAYALAWTESPTGYVVKHVPVLNSKQDDYAPMFGSADYRTMLLTSTREAAKGKKNHMATGNKPADIFVTMSNGEGRWSNPKPLEGQVNTDAEEGTPSFNADYTSMFFTRCRMSTRRSKMGCQIYEAPQTGRGWDDAQLVPLAADSMVVAHPAISPDALTLYFTADLPGGFGGMDLWKVTRESKKGPWSEPINLGPDINTPGDEVFPYIHKDGTLYFSSNGLPGMGGLDIFKAVPGDKAGWKIENMRYPINSSSDDFGITFQREREEGFFTSRRPGGRGGDDIYWFRLPPLEFNLTGSILKEDGVSPMPGAKVQLVGSDGSIQTTSTSKNGEYRFMLRPATDYVLITQNKGFFNAKDKLSTKGQTASKAFNSTIKLTAMSATIVLPNIFYDFDSWQLRPESYASLDQLIQVLVDNPNIIIELGAHTDATGSVEYNTSLSQKRAQAVLDYLIQKGVPSERLRAKGYAQQQPFVVTKELHQAQPFLPVGSKLTPEFISALPTQQQRDAATAANRRTTFRVLRDDYTGPAINKNN